MAEGRSNTTRDVFALDLVDDKALIAAYAARHAPGAVWPEVIVELRQRGFRELEIWCTRDRLVMIGEVEDRFPRPVDPTLQSVVDRWEGEMNTYQRPLENSGRKWLPMTRIFALSEHGAG